MALLAKHCETLELPLTLAHLKRFKNDILADPDVGVDRVFRALDEIQQRLWDELDSRMVFAVQPTAASYFEHSQFAPSVYERFPQIIFDAEEAGKCRALERPTACVFHLMRVTEHGLQEIARRIGIKEQRPNWEPVICKIDSELKKGYKDRQYKGMADFLANVSAHLNAVKVAWRNRVMHVDTKHTMEEAREIYGATAGLMRYIAENLPNDAGMVAIVRGIMNR